MEIELLNHNPFQSPHVKEEPHGLSLGECMKLLIVVRERHEKSLLSSQRLMIHRRYGYVLDSGEEFSKSARRPTLHVRSSRVSTVDQIGIDIDV